MTAATREALDDSEEFSLGWNIDPCRPSVAGQSPEPGSNVPPPGNHNRGGPERLQGRTADRASTRRALSEADRRVRQEGAGYQFDHYHQRSEERRVGKECRYRWSP